VHGAQCAATAGTWRTCVPGLQSLRCAQQGVGVDAQRINNNDNEKRKNERAFP